MNNETLLKKFKTPFYVFDLDELRSRIEYMKSMLPENIGLCYAVKANTFVISEAAKTADRLEVCSEGEFEICEACKVPVEKIVLSGVYKTPEFIERVVSSYENIGIYTIESLSQYELLRYLGEKYKRQLKVLVRVTTDNQFGVTKEELKEILHNGDSHINVKGIQYFSGTQKKSIKKLKRELKYVGKLIRELSEECSFECKELEYGTGSPVTYFPEESFNEEEYFKELSGLLSEFPREIKITLEMGRSIAASCGKYFTKIVDMKRNGAGNFAIADGGMNHIVYYGQSMAMKHPYFSLYPERGEGKTESYNICGSLCTINDIIVKDMPLTDLKPGDVMIFKNTGAYCMTEGISLFLSRALPAVINVAGGEACKVREHIKTSGINMAKYKK